MNQNFKQIPGYNNYLINEDGDVYNIQLKKFISPQENTDGYLRVRLRNNTKVKFEFVHKLVMLTFKGPRPKGYIIRHYPDQNKHNNNINNLSYSTQQQNSYDRIENKTYTCSKLTPELVIKIKELIILKKSHKEICKELNINISAGVISNIRHNKIWKNIGPDLSNLEHRKSSAQKLTISDVQEIKQMIKQNVPQSEISKKYNVDQSTISNIKTGKTYSNI